MNIEEIVKNACEKETLVDALSYAAIWEMERIVEYVRSNPGPWESCFRFCFERVMDRYPGDKMMLVMKELDLAKAHASEVFGYLSILSGWVSGVMTKEGEEDLAKQLFRLGFEITEVSNEYERRRNRRSVESMRSFNAFMDTPSTDDVKSDAVKALDGKKKR